MRLRAEAEQHPGRKLDLAMARLDEPVRIVLLPNALELESHLAMFPENAEGTFLLDIRRRRELDEYLERTIRFVHNLVAAVGTTIDHTRRTVRSEFPDERDPARIAFSTGVKPFASDGELRLIRDLRAFVLHRTMPGIQASMHYERGKGETYTIVFATRQLLEWDGWCSSTAKLLREAGEGIEFRPIVRRYVRSVMDLHTSVKQVVTLTNEQDLTSYRVLAIQHDKLVKEHVDAMFPPGRASR